MLPTMVVPSRLAFWRLYSQDHHSYHYDWGDRAGEKVTVSPQSTSKVTFAFYLDENHKLCIGFDQPVQPERL